MKDNHKPKMANETKKRFLKKGGYSFVLSIVVAAIVVVVNVMAGMLPDTFNQVDISQQKLYSLTDQTKNMLSALDEDITLYYIVTNGAEDDILEKTLSQYEAHSSHIDVVYKDPNKYPMFTQQYTEEAVEENSVIAVCGDKHKVIFYEDMYESEIDYTTYTETLTGFDGEGYITSAIALLTGEDLPKMYTLIGHDEMELPSDLQSLIEKDNIQVEELSLLTNETIPEDCDILLILSPLNDISEDDKNKIVDYLAQGGDVVMGLYYSEDKKPNIDALMAEYGIGLLPGVVMEEDTNYYAYQNPMYVVPRIGTSEFTEDLNYNTSFIMMPISQGIDMLTNARATLSCTPLLLSSGTSYAKQDVQNMTSYAKEDDDPLGPYTIAMSVQEQTEAGDGLANLIVFGSESIFDAEVDNVVSGGNYQLLTNIFSKLAGDTQTVAIPIKNLNYATLSVTTAQVNFWRNITMIIIPLFFVLAGLVIWFKRRSR